MSKLNRLSSIHIKTITIMENTTAGLKEKIRKSNRDHKEGKVAKTIESQTSKIPSDVYLWAAVGSMAASLSLKLMRKNSTALFIGQWAPSFLLLGIYNKMVKQQGHDQKNSNPEMNFEDYEERY